MTLTERKAKIPTPQGLADAFEVPITESTERWSELKLEDGSVIRVKLVVGAVMRLEGKYDAEGNPQYALRSSPAMTLISVPDHLKKPEGKVQ